MALMSDMMAGLQATSEEAMTQMRDQARMMANGQYGSMGSGLAGAGSMLGGVSGARSRATSLERQSAAEQAMSLRTATQSQGRGLRGQVHIDQLEIMKRDFPQFVSGYLAEEVPEGQETTENIPEDKEAISIRFKKNKKGITLNIPKLDPIVTIYNLQDDVVTFETNPPNPDELMTKNDFINLMKVCITKAEPVILKDNFYISQSGIKISKEKVKANCYKTSNKFKVTEKEFFDGTLQEHLDNVKTPRPRMDESVFQESLLTGMRSSEDQRRMFEQQFVAPIATYQDNPRQETFDWGIEEEANGGEEGGEEYEEEEEVPQRRSRRRRSGPPREIPAPPPRPSPRYLSGF